MKIKTRFATLVVSALLLVPGLASATLITFDNVAPTVGSPYTESGYIFTLNNPGSHFGDGASSNSLLDWHNGGNNAVDAIVTMTKSGGGLFDLNQLDVIIQASTDLLINGTSYGAGTHSVNLLSVSSVTFDWTFTQSTSITGGIDNLVVNAASVPEPSVIALLSLGLLGIGFTRRKA